MQGQLEPRTPAPATIPLPDKSQKGRGPWRGSLGHTPTALTPWALADPHGDTSHAPSCREISLSPSARRKRLYLSLDIEQLLASEGIDSDKLMPRHPDPHHPQTIEQGHDPLFPIYLPLKVSPASTEGQWSGDGGAGLQRRDQTQKGIPWQSQALTCQTGQLHSQGATPTPGVSGILGWGRRGPRTPGTLIPCFFPGSLGTLCT